MISSVFKACFIVGYLCMAVSCLQGVTDLTVHTIKTFPKENDFVLVYFYSSDSKVTKDVEPDHLKVVNDVSKKLPEIRLARMDMAKEVDLVSTLHVLEVPMYMLFKHGKHYDFRGILNPEHVETWLEVALNKPLVVNSAKNLQELRDMGTLIVGCFPGKNPKAGYDAYLKASEHFVGTPYIPLPRFTIVETASASRELGINKGTVTIFKHFEPNGKVTYDGDISNFDVFYKWVHSEVEPVVYPYGHAEFHYIVASHRVKYRHILFMPSTARDFQQTFNSFKAAAKQFMRNSSDIDILFMHVDTSLEHLQNVISFFHVNVDEDIPCNRITKSDEFHSRFMPNEKDFTENGFAKFTKDVTQGKVLRNIRSKHIPDQWDRFPVKEIVGENYEEVTRNKQKTVFMFYYIPKDTASERMVPVVEEIGRRYRANASVLIGQMDISANDGEIDIHYDIPNFKLITKENQKIKYLGDRNVNAISKFIDTNGKLQIGAPPPAKMAGEEEIEFLGRESKKLKEWALVEEEDRKRRWADEDQKLRDKIRELNKHEGLGEPEKEFQHTYDGGDHHAQQHVDVQKHLDESFRNPDDLKHEHDHIIVGYDHSYEL